MKPFLPVLLLSLLLFFSDPNAHAQYFEWAASACNVDIEYNLSSSDKQGNLLVGGLFSVPNYIDGEQTFFDGNGKEIELHNPMGQYHVFCYSPKGQVLWKLSFYEKYTELKGIACDESGFTYLLVKVETIEEDDKDNELGIIPELDNGEEKLFKAGYYLLKYKNDKFISKSYLVQDDLEIGDFKYYKKGDFILSGHADADFKLKKAGPGGGDFLMLFNQNGKIKWVDVVSYERKTCCTSVDPDAKCAFTSDGQIYLAGTFISGAVFSNSSTIHAKANPAYKDDFECYLAAYNSAGKINWVSPAKAGSTLKALHTSNNIIYLAFNNRGNPVQFGQQTDTSYGKLFTLAQFGSNQKLNWIKNIAVKNIFDMNTDLKGNLYISGATAYTTVKTYEKDTLKPYHDTYISSYTKSGTYRWVKSFWSGTESLKIQFDNCNNLYLVGHAFFTLSGKLNMLDKALISCRAHGSVPLIAKLNNTLPPEIAGAIHKSEAKQTEEKTIAETFTCDLSPGPWSLGNFPNPFHESTTFAFQITYDDHITLTLIDMNGITVATVIDKQLFEKGLHEFSYPSNLPPGTYIAILKGTSCVVSEKILVQ